MMRLVLSATLLIAGCGTENMDSVYYESPSSEKMDSTTRSTSSEPTRTAEFNTVDEGQAGEDGAKVDLREVERKIIYTANVELAVEEFAGKPAEVKALVEKYDGRIASSTLSAESGSSRSGHWRLRVPVKHFDAFLEDAKALGEIIQYGTDSQEVTDEYYDVQSRIKNKEVERNRLQAILEDKDRVAKLKDVLDVERELSRVQGDIEQFQGRMRRLNNLTSLTTVELNIRQIRDYVPPEAVSFGTQSRRSLEVSLLALKRTGQALVLAVIALAPWLPVFIIGFLLLRFGWKRLRATPK